MLNQCSLSLVQATQGGSEYYSNEYSNQPTSTSAYNYVDDDERVCEEKKATVVATAITKRAAS